MTRAMVVLSVLLAGCNTERVDRQGWTLHAVAGACAASDEARPALLAAWGGPASRVDGMSCTLDEVLSIDEPKESAADACCYPVTCTSALSSVEEMTLFDAACFPVACELGKSSGFTADDVSRRLAAKLGRCVIGEAEPSTRSTLRCVYSVNARYSCSTAPG